MLNKYQCRAGRALLDWSQRDLADRSRLSAGTVRDFETGRRTPTRNNLAAMRRALEGAGVRLFDDDSPGVRLLPEAKRGTSIELSGTTEEPLAEPTGGESG